MSGKKHLAMIGSGPSALYLLKHLLDQAETARDHLESISIFEKGAQSGFGMPYSPETTDRENMANIPSEEIPALNTNLADWLAQLDEVSLQELHLDRERIDRSRIYPRLVLGHYFQNQFLELVGQIRAAGIQVHLRATTEVLDLRISSENSKVLVVTRGGELDFDYVIIATGHSWQEKDHPGQGYFGSPWPISKLLPKENEVYNFAIGTLGASLSAFDVVASLAPRHGSFLIRDGKLVYKPFPNTENFKMVMHSAHGRLPHLRYAITNAAKKIHQKVSRQEIADLVNEKGFLAIHLYFDKLCRPLLRKAFLQDGLEDIAELLANPQFTLEDFIEKMSEEHEYADAFAGMRYEMKEAAESVNQDKPIHWKEMVDDLVYTLNFHAELLSAEDHMLLHSKLLPFVMNVIAAMPLESADKLLALHDAGKLEIKSGKAHVADDASFPNTTTILVEDDGKEDAIHYRLFIDCSGQKPLELENYPFPWLVENEVVRSATARFAGSENADQLPPEKADKILRKGNAVHYRIGGIQIDAQCRVVGQDGVACRQIYDVAYPHTTGIRPYSYGLQSCSDTGEIVIRSLLKEFQRSE